MSGQTLFSQKYGIATYLVTDNLQQQYRMENNKTQDNPKNNTPRFKNSPKSPTAIKQQEHETNNSNQACVYCGELPCWWKKNKGDVQN